MEVTQLLYNFSQNLFSFCFFNNRFFIMYSVMENTDNDNTCQDNYNGFYSPLLSLF